jgi:hypothetical protein
MLGKTERHYTCRDCHGSDIHSPFWIDVNTREEKGAYTAQGYPSRYRIFWCGTCEEPKQHSKIESHIIGGE